MQASFVISAGLSESDRAGRNPLFPGSFFDSSDQEA